MKICDEWAKWGGGGICAPKDGAPLKRVKAALGEEELASGGRRLLDMHVAHLGKRGPPACDHRPPGALQWVSGQRVSAVE